MRNLSALLFAAWSVLTATVHAADPPLVSFEVGGRGYAVFERGSTLWVVESPVRIQLRRDATQAPPACEALDDSLAALASEIERCKMSPTGGTCEAIGRLIDAARSQPDTLGESALAQGFRLMAAPNPTSDADVLAEARRRTGADASRIRLIRAPQALGRPERLVPIATPGGTSWASRLVGWIDLGALGIEFDASARAFVTRDHVLACGILAGDVRLQWEQMAAGEERPVPFEPAQLWSLYQALPMRLASPGGSALQHAVRVGVALGDVLREAGLVDDELIERIDVLLDAFFEGDALVFRQGLNEADVLAIAAALGRSGEFALTWTGGAT